MCVCCGGVCVCDDVARGDADAAGDVVAAVGDGGCDDQRPCYDVGIGAAVGAVGVAVVRRGSRLLSLVQVQ